MRKMIRSKKYLSWEGRHRFRLYTACRRYLKDKTDGIRYEVPYVPHDRRHVCVLRDLMPLVTSV